MNTFNFQLYERLKPFALVLLVSAIHQTGFSQSTSTQTLAFASDRSGRFQVWQVQVAPPGQNQPSPTIVTTAGSGSQESRAPDWSKQGKIAYQFGASGVRGIHVINPDGMGDIRVTLSPSDEINPSWSPDGQSIVYAFLIGGNYDLWIHHFADPANGTPDEDYPLIGFAGSQETRPAWSPDGTRIAFVSNVTGNNEIAVVDLLADNVHPGRFIADTPTFLTSNTFNDFDPAWSPDSTQIVFSSTRSGGRDIYRMSATFGEGDPANFVQLTTSSAGDFNPAWSPDGKYIAFSSDRDGNREIYVMSAIAGEADAGNLVRITNDTGNDDDPAWNPIVSPRPPSLNVSVTASAISSGYSYVTGRGSVTVTDQNAQTVPNAVVTIFGPLGSKLDQNGNPRFVNLFLSPLSGVTDQNGKFNFDGMEDTQIPFSTAVNFEFVASATVNGQPATGMASQPIDLLGAGSPIPPQPPGEPPLPPEKRIPPGANPFTPAMKVQFANAAQEQFLHGLADLTVDIALLPFGLLLDDAKPLESYLLAGTRVGLATWDIWSVSSTVAYYAAGQRFLALSGDPPDLNFTTVAFPQLQQPLPVVAGGSISAMDAQLMNKILAYKAIIQGYLVVLQTSVDRYFTALGAADLESAALQRNAILAYGDSLTHLFETDADLIEELLAAFQAEGVPNINLSAADITALQNDVVANGLSSAILQVFQTLNFSPTEIQAITDSFLLASPTQVAGDLFSAMQSSANASRASAFIFNEPPVAFDQSVTNAINTPVAITLTGVDPEGHTLSFSVASNPGSGLLSGIPPNLTYTPNLGFTGPDRFTFTASDGSATSSVATVIITVNGISPPTITCSDNIAVATDPGQCSSVVSFSPSAADSGVTVVCNPPSASVFPVGATTVNCTAMDATGNSDLQFHGDRQ